MASYINGGANSCIWLINSGCIMHITKDPQLFSNIDRSIQSKVTLGHGKTIFTKGKGIVEMHTKKGPKYISNILYVPRLLQNLFSSPQLL